MPQLSAFTECGLLELTSDPSPAEEFYDLLKGLKGNQREFPDGSYDEAILHAQAMALARAGQEARHAGAQANPRTAYDLLPVLEHDYRIAPGRTDTLPDRQGAVAAREILPVGPRWEAMTNGLRALLGSKFLALVTAANSNATPSGPWSPTVYPSNPGATAVGRGHFADDRLAPRFYRLIDPIVQVGVPSWAAYQGVDGNAPPDPLQVGDVVVVQTGNTAAMEPVTVTAIAAAPPAGSFASNGLCFQATFLSPHDPGAVMTTGTVPYWWSTARHDLVVVAAPYASDATVRAKVNDFMARITRGVSTWGIVDPVSTTSTGGTIGPLTVGSRIGTCTLGALNYVNSP